MVLAGLVLLVAGAEGLVRGASRLSLAVGIPPLIIGLSVVAFGTSSPELAVSLQGAMAGTGGVALGNAVGSNIFNVLAVLGCSALAGRLLVRRRLVRVEVPLLVLATAVVWLLAADGHLAMAEGGALATGLLAYTILAYTLSRREPAAVAAEYAEALGDEPAGVRGAWPLALTMLAAGLVALVVGARLLVDGATDVAGGLGVPDILVGLTVVAAGTSLPELVTSVVAVRRGELDIAVGNVVGSNLFNLLGVLGAAALAGGGLDVPRAAIVGDLPVALVTTLVALPLLATGLVIERWEGGLLLAAYAAYVAVLVLVGLDSALATTARWALLAVLVTLAVVLAGLGLAGRTRARPPAGG